MNGINRVIERDWRLVDIVHLISFVLAVTFKGEDPHGYMPGQLHPGPHVYIQTNVQSSKET